MLQQSLEYMEEKILVSRSSMPEFQDYIEEIKELWESHWLTNMGVKHKQLEKELKEFLGVNYINLVCNGHMALELALQMLNLQGEVITTPFTFASTTLAIVRSGLKPVFCDIDPETYTIDTTRLEQLITERTCAIVPVHVYGNICDVDEIDRIAKKYGLKVIYDAAHACGIEKDGRGIGSFGDASCFSFHATKVFQTIEGGAVCFQNEAYEEELNQLKNFGMESPEVISRVGTNAKMNEFSAAMGLCNLKIINREIEKRRLVVERYRELLDGVEGIKICKQQEGVKNNYAFFPIVIDDRVFGAGRDEVLKHLAEKNIMARKYFYPLTSMFECFHGKFNSDETPVAKRICDNVLTLPLYSDLELEKVEHICEVLLDCKVR